MIVLNRNSNLDLMRVKGFSIIVFWMFVAACKKEDGFLSISYPSVYHKSIMKANGELRVYTKAGEITDSAVISRFNQTDSFIFSQIASYMIDSRGTLDTIQFSTGKQASVVDRDISVNCTVKVQSKSLLLTAVDPEIGSTSGEVFTRKVDYNIGQVKPEVFSEYLISSMGGYYIFGYSYKPKFILIQSGSQLVAPFIQFAEHGMNTFFGKRVNNILQSDFYKSLPAGDTLTLHEYLIFYEKR